uniref:Uncharacterized protein n=1 Tax=Anopheles melas TaxID=34690 RepID=A0A182TXQ8_9DIPT
MLIWEQTSSKTDSQTSAKARIRVSSSVFSFALMSFSSSFSSPQTEEQPGWAARRSAGGACTTDGHRLLDAVNSGSAGAGGGGAGVVRRVVGAGRRVVEGVRGGVGRGVVGGAATFVSVYSCLQAGGKNRSFHWTFFSWDAWYTLFLL